MCEAYSSVSCSGFAPDSLLFPVPDGSGKTNTGAKVKKLSESQNYFHLFLVYLSVGTSIIILNEKDMNKRFLQIGGLLMCGLLVFGCEKEDGKGDEPTFDENGEVTVSATDYESWTCFSFESGRSEVVPVREVKEGVAGMYTGTLALQPLMGIPLEGQDNLTVLVNRVTEDVVEVTLKDLTFAMPAMSGKPGSKADTEIKPYSLTAEATAKKEGDRWMITGRPTENVVTGGEVSRYKLKVSGFIGATLDSDVELKCEITPGNMPFAIEGTYTAKNTEREIKEITFNGQTGKYVPGRTFEMDPADLKGVAWNIAFHKYDVRTNGGSVLRLETTDWDAVTAAPAEGFVPDGRGVVIASMKDMLPDGNIGFQCTPLNEVLASFLTVTPTGTMPPFKYELNRNIFLVRTATGKVWKMQFSQYTYGGESLHAKFRYEELK